MCHGLYQDTVLLLTLLGSESFSLVKLKTSYKTGKDACGNVLWYSVPAYDSQIANKQCQGTIKSTHCKGFGSFSPSDTCTSCLGLLDIKSFQMRIRRQIDDDEGTILVGQSQGSSTTTNSVNNKYLNEKKVQSKLKRLRKTCKTQRLIIYRMALKLARSRAVNRKLTSKMRENCKRGDVSAICENLHRAYNKGCLTGKSKTLQFLKDISSNISKSGKGHRYGTFSRELFEAVRIVGGPRTARLLASNTCGPSDTTQKRAKRKNRFNFVPGPPSKQVFEHLAHMYGQIKSSVGVSGNVLVQTAEDETVIIGQVQWDSKTDQGWGWCGQKQDNHVCDPSFVHVVGDDDQAYERLVQAYRDNKIAGFARVIMINPLHQKIPPLVVLLQATCNTFTHEMVLQQWNEIKALYDQYLLPVLGPLVGHASDGDSRRRKLHLMQSKSNLGQRYGIDHDNFVLSGVLSDDNETQYVENLADQDFIHNGKKLINHLRHASRVLSIGGNLCHMNHLQLVKDNVNSLHHGLQQDDIDRSDRMNWESAQRVLFPRVREYLQRIQVGETEPQENVQGTIAYLHMVWRYIEIYYSLTASLLDRITSASFVANFLKIWRLWVYRTGDLLLGNNFVSRETFQDVSLSCHHVVLLIKASRDFAPNHDVCFERTGTDVCEEYFSANGSFVVNKHTYTICDMFRNLGNMNRLQEIFTDDEGPDNPKKHRKGENIWYKGHNALDEKPDLKDWPSDDDIVKAWEKGLCEAQSEMRSLGIKPDTDDRNSVANDWFFKPHSIDATTASGLNAQMWNEDMDPQGVQVNVLEYDGPAEADDGGLRADPVLRANLTYIAQQVADEDNEREQSQTATTIQVPDVGPVHKSTIFGLLNTEPDGPSTDRLRRVRSNKTKTYTATTESDNDVGLFDDIAVYIKDRGESAEIQLGRVIRIRNRDKSTVEYRKPMNLEEMSKYPKVQLVVAMYIKQDQQYQYCGDNCKEFMLYSVVCRVSLSVCDNGLFNIAPSDNIKLDKFLEDISQTKTGSRTSKQTNNRTAVTGEGRHIIVQNPVDGPDDQDCRRSKRQRKMIVYE
jgi:hypothetical protein